ncbi:NUDIX hydrolase [Spirosoma validum]|uniref:GDP-mannose pyrophosphatase n=1 Tax=Spirosoma validum TaxID=2771355 RepID=A0A927GHM3_9BACT|nr:NUDIX hydrolase [Spirosoma validum]MBD2757868.1 NUDIX hydrolase [Spirosoma validum]
MEKLQSWQTVSTRELVKSKWLRVRQDTCRLPSGREIDDYFVVEAPDGAVIVAVTQENELVLVRQYKHGFGGIVLELPAGIVESKEVANETIIRELSEETGYFTPNVEYIATLVTKPARMSARTFVYFANAVTKDSQGQENDSEVIETVLVPIADLPALLQRGDIITETSLAALLMVWNRLTA